MNPHWPPSWDQDHGHDRRGRRATCQRADYAYVDLVKAGDHAVANAVAVIQKIAQLKAVDSGIRRILGENFLEQFDPLIDNRQLVLCLDTSGALKAAVQGERVPLVEPRGSAKDMPFTSPFLVSAQLSGHKTEVLLRLDSGSITALFYITHHHDSDQSINPSPRLKRNVDGAEQTFAVQPPQDILIGKRSVRRVSFVLPLNSIGEGPTPVKTVCYRPWFSSVCSSATQIIFRDHRAIQVDRWSRQVAVKPPNLKHGS